jgi:hypothetical protein
VFFLFCLLLFLFIYWHYILFVWRHGVVGRFYNIFVKYVNIAYTRDNLCLEKCIYCDGELRAVIYFRDVSAIWLEICRSPGARNKYNLVLCRETTASDIISDEIDL